MQLCKLQLPSGAIRTGVVEGEDVHYPENAAGGALSDILHAANPLAVAIAYRLTCTAKLPLAQATLRAPVDQQEIWAAGVTYKRSREARERESEGAAKFYDLVYKAERPELFFKATPAR